MRTVRAPDGHVWTVRRTLGWPRWRNTAGAASAFVGLRYAPVDGLLGGLVVGTLFAIALGFVILLFLPLVLFVVELVLLVPAVLLFVRPWRIVATTSGPPARRLEWKVRGWRESLAAVERIARRVEHGEFPAPETAE